MDRGGPNLFKLGLGWVWVQHASTGFTLSLNIMCLSCVHVGYEPNVSAVGQDWAGPNPLQTHYAQVQLGIGQTHYRRIGPSQCGQTYRRHT